MDIVSYNRAVLAQGRVNAFVASGAGDKVLKLYVERIADTGPQKMVAQFPFDGTITGVSAIGSHAGAEDTKVNLVKCSLLDYGGAQTWVPVTADPLTISAGGLVSDIPTIPVSEVDKGDYFRLDVVEVGEGFEGLEVQVIIKIFE